MKKNYSIGKLKGVGPKKQEEFSKLKIETLEDLIYFFPRTYQDRTKIKRLKDCINEEQVGVVVKVTSKGRDTRIPGRRLLITKIPIEENGIIAEVVWYNMPYIKHQLEVGKSYYLYGKIKKYYNKIQIIAPEFKLIDETSIVEQGILPIYHASSKLNQKEIRKLVKYTLKNMKDEIEEYLPLDIRKRYQLCDLNFALENIHFPKGIHDYNISKKRLIFDELFFIQMALNLIKKQNKEYIKGLIFKETPEVQDFINKLPFQLTNSQKKVIKEVASDVSSGKTMNRLVQGDVGSGKTIVAIICLLMAHLNGYQGAMMAPTEILAKQHYVTFKELFKDYNINVALLTGSLKTSEKKKIIEKNQTGDINIIIGTHALIQENVTFHNLGLVVTDEQHRFGVKQRLNLSNKGENPHVMVMTATPIPRTLSFILHGDLDVSIINELPPGRKPVQTYKISSNHEERLYNFIKKQIKDGRQAYIVCPLVEESDTIEAQSVLEVIEYLKEEYFTEEKIEYIHGKMKNCEKESLMEKFQQGTIDVLVSTTIIEVGVNVSNANIMVVQNAERFGLAQLHQLRGRIGRGTFQSYCFLITDNKSDVTKQRMEALTSTNDGFIIAEKDLATRGPGEFLGVRQHGLPEFKIANLLRDIEILKLVQNACKEIEESKEFYNVKEYITYKLEEQLGKIILN